MMMNYDVADESPSQFDDKNMKQEASHASVSLLHRVIHLQQLSLRHGRQRTLKRVSALEKEIENLRQQVPDACVFFLVEN